MDFVNARSWQAFMYNICQQVIGGGDIFVLLLSFWSQEVPKVNAFDWKIDYGGILFDEKCVLSEPLDVQNDVRWQLGQLEFTNNVVLVGLVLFFGVTIELAEEGEV